MNPSDEKTLSKAPSGRPQRTPIGTRNILTVKGKDPNFEYRIVNDTDDRITQFQEAGYELVPNEAVTVGDKRVNAPTSLSSNKQISVGQGTKAYLMRIRKEWYQEDQVAKLGQVAALEQATKEKALDGTYGELKISRD